VGLANIRERLALLYGEAAALDLRVNVPTGFVARITLPAAGGTSGAVAELRP
jgi:sensor histidine kinase YesM